MEVMSSLDLISRCADDPQFLIAMFGFCSLVFGGMFALGYDLMSGFFPWLFRSIRSLVKRKP